MLRPDRLIYSATDGSDDALWTICKCCFRCLEIKPSWKVNLHMNSSVYRSGFWSVTIRFIINTTLDKLCALENHKACFTGLWLLHWLTEPVHFLVAYVCNPSECMVPTVPVKFMTRDLKYSRHRRPPWEMMCCNGRRTADHSLIALVRFIPLKFPRFPFAVLFNSSPHGFLWFIFLFSSFV